MGYKCEFDYGIKECAWVLKMCSVGGIGSGVDSTFEGIVREQNIGGTLHMIKSIICGVDV